jgi:hypothetical protein
MTQTTVETNNDASAPKTPETAPEAAEAKTTPTPAANAEPKKENPNDIRIKMYGDKVKPKESKEPEKEAPKPEDAGKPKEKTEDSKEEKLEKKTASERIQETRRELLAERERRLKAEQENKKLLDELIELRKIEDKDKTPKEQFREILIEEKLNENMAKNNSELDKFVYSLTENEAEEFKVNYDYYIPALSQHDPDTLKFIGQYPQKYEMISEFAKAVNSGIFTLQEWVNTPTPVKYRKLQELANIMQLPPEERAKIISPTPPATTPGGVPAATAPGQKTKEVPNSIVPNLKSKPEEPASGEKEPGYYFYRTLERRGK